MILFEITTGYVGKSYIRAYCWAENEEKACELFITTNPGYKLRSLTTLLRSNSKPFCSPLTDDGSSPWL